MKGVKDMKMKKALLPLLCLSVASLLPACTNNKEKPVDTSDSGDVSEVSIDSGVVSSEEEAVYEDVDYHGKVKVYYHNDTGDYANKRIYAWGPGLGGTEYNWDNADSASSDDFGVYHIFDLGQEPWAKLVSTTFSFIIKNAGTWNGQSTDTVTPFGKYTPFEEDGMITIYACDGEGKNIDTFAQKAEALGDRVKNAYFKDWRTLHVIGGGSSVGRQESEVGKIDSYEVYAYDAAYLAMDSDAQALHKNEYLVASGNAGGQKEIDVALKEDAIPYLSYTVEARMSDNPSRKKAKIASFTSLFDDPTFIEKYTYSGNDLGVSGNHERITFKLWAPTSSRVQLKMYMVGTPGALQEVYDPNSDSGRLFEMEMGKQGVWQISIDYDYFDPDFPYFYNYLITNSLGTNEVIDPYAQSSGINGVRGAIIDWEGIEKPDGWADLSAGRVLSDIKAANELSVYEAHIRDLTMDDTWNGHERHGTYNAFVEAGTKYEGLTTGFDHIVETGINAVQLLPVFDQDNDERWKKEDKMPICFDYDLDKAVYAPDYNWGYNPQNYNCVEGSYATNPYDGVTKVKEFQNLVNEFAKKDIRVIMDVVYNHFASVNGNPLQKCVPDYYLRRDANGNYFDGTGVGNVTASERTMMRKFIVDSCCFWAEKYNIKGFRFDLMGCLDTQTMRAVKDALYDIDPDIVVYGEPWAGSSDGSTGMQAGYTEAKTEAVYQKLYDNGKGSVGLFNDRFRDGMKGNTGWGSVSPDWGFISKGPSDLNNEIKARVAEGLLGAYVNNKDDHIGFDPAQSVSFVACHDNYTLYDQLNYCINYDNGSGKNADIDDTTGEVFNAVVGSIAACELNQGVAFLNGGDEIFRQKVIMKDDPIFDEMVESYKHGRYDRNTGETTYQKTPFNDPESVSSHCNYWVEGDGIEMKSGNWLVRNSYKYGDDVNSFKWDRKVKYNTYYQRVKDAIHARKDNMANLFGRSYEEIKDRKINNVFDSSYHTYEEDGQQRPIPMVAAYLGGRDGGVYYLCVAGRANTEWTDLGCGNCDIKVLYSSNGSHSKDQTFTITNGKLGASKYEVLLVKATNFA